ncbi:MAG TPA: hypothetical protein VI456_12210 [Polyangia bacterium]
MTAKSQTVLLSLVVLLAMVGSATAGTPREVVRFEETNWSLVRTFREVAPEVARALRSRFGKDDRLANVGEPFDSTDVDFGRPSRRFVLAGREAHRWFVLYEKGGRGHHLVLVVLDIASGDVRPVMLAHGMAGIHDDVAGWRADLLDIRKALETRQLTLVNPGAKDHY